jgi:hypothetical protein
MNSNLFGLGVPKFVVDSTEVDIDNSFIETIALEGRTIEHESIINSTRNWTNVSDYDHITITVLCRLHKKGAAALNWFKGFYDAYNKTEVDVFRPSQTADGLVDKDGEFVPFRLEITELFPLESIWSYDTFRMIFKSKRPVNLGSLTVVAAAAVITDSSNEMVGDTTGEIITE